MPLVENGKIVEDRYVRVDDDAPIPERVPVIVLGEALSGGGRRR